MRLFDDLQQLLLTVKLSVLFHRGDNKKTIVLHHEIQTHLQIKLQENFVYRLTLVIFASDVAEQSPESLSATDLVLPVVLSRHSSGYPV